MKLIALALTVIFVATPICVTAAYCLGVRMGWIPEALDDKPAARSES